MSAPRPSSIGCSTATAFRLLHSDWLVICCAAALMFTMLLVFLEIRHYMTGGNIYRTTAPLAEVALQVCAGLVMAIGLERLRERTHSSIHNAGALIIATLSLAAIVLGLALIDNPFFTG